MAVSRFQAAGIHLGISSGIALAFLSLVYFVWYPEPYFAIGGGEHLLLVLISVDVTLGPLLTLIVFKAGKPGLKLDLSIIAALQLAALIYGASVIIQARPIYVVYVIDRFSVVSPGDISDAAWQRAARSRYHDAGWTGPDLVSAPIPSDREQRNQLMVDVLSGKMDLTTEPRLYVPYASDKANVSKHLRAIDEFGTPLPKPLARALATKKLDPATLGWLPLDGRTRSAVMLIRRSDAQPEGLVDLDPWKYVRRKPHAKTALPSPVTPHPVAGPHTPPAGDGK